MTLSLQSRKPIRVNHNHMKKLHFYGKYSNWIENMDGCTIRFQTIFEIFIKFFINLLEINHKS